MRFPVAHRILIVLSACLAYDVLAEKGFAAPSFGT
jgi:hypothetical protein